MKRVILTAIRSGSGKTTITCGILKELKDRGLSVKGYKCGPDYIDPMFHRKALGIPTENLDLFFSDEEYIKGILKRNDENSISIIEGAMGIYDGILGLGKEGSVYDVAVKTNTPIVLIVDAGGIGSTIISIIKGILLDDEKRLIKGIILNKISDHFYSSIAPQIEAETGIKVLGYLQKLKDVSIDSRHLGLKLPSEIIEIESKLETVRSKVSKTVDIDAIISIASEAGDLPEGDRCATNAEALLGADSRNSQESINKESVKTRSLDNKNRENKPRIAVAMDEAFCFYYEDNFRVLRDAGAEIVFFSPLHDKKLPDNISGILLGGGYPELKLKELEANESMRNSIKSAIEAGMPSLAECGGFMYLHDSIEVDGKSYKMLGVVPGKCFNTGKLCRFGYVNLQVNGYEMKGHEFHYFDSTNNGDCGTAVKPGSGKEWKFGHYDRGRLWGFPHLYYGSCKKFIDDFVNAMTNYNI